MRHPPTPFHESIRSAQAESALESLTVTLLSSFVVMITSALTLWLYTAETWILFWIGSFVLFTGYRALRIRTCRRMELFRRDATATLRMVNRQTLIAGSFWAVMPIMMSGRLETVGGSFVVFIIAGAAAGAVIQNTAYAAPALLFLSPSLLGTTVALISNPTPASMIVVINVMLFTFMMARQSLKSERSYWQSEVLRREATALAQSLAEANGEIVAANARLNILAHQDTLTSLVNRASFNEELAARLAEAANRREEVALAIIDLDNFKGINDTQGHGAGDRVLQEAAKRLRVLSRPDEVVARLGGDEFATIVSGVGARARALELVGRIVRELPHPIEIDRRLVNISASAGLASFPADALTPHELMASADIALYAAKRDGKRRVAEFDAAMKRRLDVQQRLEDDLGEALAQGLLDVHFQPQIELNSGATIGHEALVRWHHPTLGDIPAPEIVAAALDTHRSEDLTAYVLDGAIGFVDELARLGDEETIVSVNVSSDEFKRYSLADLVLGRLMAAGVDPRRIELEITEEAMLDAESAGKDLKRLASAGVRLAIDDFGTGHHSLANAIGFNLDRLKIDRTFVAGIDHDERHQLLVDTILSLGRKFGVAVIAQGVESRAEVSTLASLGCRQAQGFFFARPLPAEAALARLFEDIGGTGETIANEAKTRRA